jgi:hypothetical protein
MPRLTIPYKNGKEPFQKIETCMMSVTTYIVSNQTAVFFLFGSIQIVALFATVI